MSIHIKHLHKTQSSVTHLALCLQEMNALAMVMQTVETMKTILNAVSGSSKQLHISISLLIKHIIPSMYIAVKQVINVSGTVDYSCELKSN